jgi:hypothetical protein
VLYYTVNCPWKLPEQIVAELLTHGASPRSRLYPPPWSHLGSKGIPTVESCPVVVYILCIIRRVRCKCCSACTCNWTWRLLRLAAVAILTCRRRRFRVPSTSSSGIVIADDAVIGRRRRLYSLQLLFYCCALRR